jgi:hypothetical protein
LQRRGVKIAEYQKRSLISPSAAKKICKTKGKVLPETFFTRTITGTKLVPISAKGEPVGSQSLALENFEKEIEKAEKKD